MSIITSLLFAAAICSLCLAGEIVVIEKPDYVEFQQTDSSLKLSDLQYVVSGWFGLTTHKEVDYHGVLSSQPFSHPQAIAMVSLFNSKDVLKQIAGSRIQTTEDEVYVPTHKLEHHLNEFYHTDSYTYQLSLETQVHDLDGRLEGLKDDEHSVRQILSDRFNLQNVDSEDVEVKQFMRQIALAIQALDKMKSFNAGLADLFSFELVLPTQVEDGVRAEMERVAQSFIKQMSDSLKEKYGDSFILLAVSWDSKHSVSSRKTRSLMETEEDEKKGEPSAKKTLNVATAYSDDYAAIFHIILWLVVFMALVVIYVTYGMMSMDPGSDSIIYRMTTTRLKKD